jgi:hypothetical protein
MGLTLGKTLDRLYSVRIPFLDGYYNIGIFFNKRSTFLLFKVDPDFSKRKNLERTIKISMFKNLESSRFVETFLELHCYRNNNLDIMNQFQGIKSEYFHDVNIISNETINLAKIEVNDRILYDTLTLYSISLTTYLNEFLFLIAERQNIIKKLNKKVVRTTALQIATTPSIAIIDEFYQEKLEHEQIQNKQIIIPSETKTIINLSEEDKKEIK